MKTFTRMTLSALLSLVSVAGAFSFASADDRFESWPLLTPEFPSTGGGGVIIKGYDPKLVDGKCVTPFSAHLPDGAVYANIVEFETEATQGGILCKNGKWRAVDGSATGTTPLRVFIKDGIARRSP